MSKAVSAPNSLLIRNASSRRIAVTLGADATYNVIFRVVYAVVSGTVLVRATSLSGPSIDQLV